MFICESCGFEYEDKRERECDTCSLTICEYCKNSGCLNCGNGEEE